MRGDCEIKSVNRHSMIIDGAVSSWNELIALVYFIGKFVIMKDRKIPYLKWKGMGNKMSMLKNEKNFCSGKLNL